MRASSVPQPDPGPRPRRRTVLAGAAVVAASAAVLPAAGGASASPKDRRSRPHRWRTAAIGGTGFVTGLMFHPAVRGLAYARTDIGGAYRWDDRGARWTALVDHIGWDDWNLMGVEAMAVDPAHPDRLYLALGTYTQAYASPGAVLRSEDRGATWKRTDLTVRLGANEDGRGCGERLLVDPRDSETLWLGTRHDGLPGTSSQPPAPRRRCRSARRTTRAAVRCTSRTRTGRGRTTRPTVRCTVSTRCRAPGPM